MRVFPAYVLIACLSMSPLFGFPDRDARGNYTENFTHLQIQARLKMESMTYREGDNVELLFTVTNHGKEIVRLFPSGEWRETFALQIRDEENTLVEPQDSLAVDPNQIRRNQIHNSVGDLTKEIALAPRESYSYKILLNEVYHLIPNRRYTITGYFYPNATESRKNILLAGNQSEGRMSYLRTENTVRFYYESRRIQDSVGDTPRSQSDWTASTQEAGMSPEETVYLFLGAELKKNWSNYFKWLSVPEFILAYDQFSGVYIQATEREKEMVEAQFRKYLSSEPSGRLKYYKIIGVEKVNKVHSKVRVYVERLEERIPTRYEYEYTLRKNPDTESDLWRIHGVIARVRK